MIIFWFIVYQGQWEWLGAVICEQLLALLRKPLSSWSLPPATCLETRSQLSWWGFPFQDTPWVLLRGCFLSGHKFVLQAWRWWGSGGWTTKSWCTSSICRLKVLVKAKEINLTLLCLLCRIFSNQLSRICIWRLTSFPHLPLFPPCRLWWGNAIGMTWCFFWAHNSGRKKLLLLHFLLE